MPDGPFKNNLVRTPEREDRFFESLAAGNSVRVACLAAGFNPKRIYQYRYNYPYFDQKWNDAVRAAQVNK